MTAMSVAQRSRAAPNAVKINPPRAPGPLVVVEICSEQPDRGQAALAPTLPLQYPKINPRPADKQRKDTISRRSILNEESSSNGFLMQDITLRMFAGIET